jgi:hypothetical protein
MKNEINNNPELSARQAYDNVVQQIAREDRGNIPNFESARSTIDRELQMNLQVLGPLHGYDLQPIFKF